MAGIRAALRDRTTIGVARWILSLRVLGIITLLIWILPLLIWVLPSRIMYSAYLSYAQVKEYLSFLLERDLIRYEEGSGLYKLSERGMKVLEAYEGISEMIALDSQKPVNNYPFNFA